MSSFYWNYQPGEYLTLFVGHQPLFHYQFNTQRRKAFCHPVHTLDGVLVTTLEPWDHVWHRGIWFSWKYINGVNYWEETAEGKEDGVTQFVPPESVQMNPLGVTIVTCYCYYPPGGTPVLSEERRVRIDIPTEKSYYRADWTFTFQAGEKEVVLDRTPIEPGTPWGGYGGFSWRAARSLGNFHALNSEGQRDKEVEHQRARWATLWGQSDGGRNLLAGVAILDHPSNPRHPSYWRCILDPGFGYLNPCPIQWEPLTLNPGEETSFRYRMLIYTGEPAVEVIEKEFRDFLEKISEPS